MNRRKFLGLSGTALLGSQVQAMPLSIFGHAQETNTGLHVRFLGTGAADWNGKDERGEQRRLTSILFDHQILIDFTPTDEDMLPKGCKPTVIFYTHSHGDHYNPAAAMKLGIKTVYLSNTWYDIAVADFKKQAKELKLPMPMIIPILIGVPVKLDGLTITPLPANHATSYAMEQTLIYLIEKGNTRLLYATDTSGLPGVATRLAGIDAHVQQGNPITALIMEATMGMDYEDDFRLFTHSSVALVARTVRVLTATKRYLPKPGQSVYLTHMARTLHGTQAELDKHLPTPLRAAYDGLEIVL